MYYTYLNLWGIYVFIYRLTGECSEGYYCPGGQDTDTPAEYICPQGHYCLQAVAL